MRIFSLLLCIALLYSCGPKSAPEKNNSTSENQKDTSANIPAETKTGAVIHPDLQPFLSLLGTWEERDGANAFVEEWKLDGDRLAGVGFALSNSDTTFGEQVFIEEFGGYITYIAIAGDQQPVIFTGKKTGEGNYIFENKEHDFPQRIMYTWDENNLTAVVEGMMDGKPFSETISMKRK